MLICYVIITFFEPAKEIRRRIPPVGGDSPNFTVLAASRQCSTRSSASTQSFENSKYEKKPGSSQQEFPVSAAYENQLFFAMTQCVIQLEQAANTLVTDHFQLRNNF